MTRERERERGKGNQEEERSGGGRRRYRGGRVLVESGVEACAIKATRNPPVLPSFPNKPAFAQAHPFPLYNEAFLCLFIKFTFWHFHLCSPQLCSSWPPLLLIFFIFRPHNYPFTHPDQRDCINYLENRTLWWIGGGRLSIITFSLFFLHQSWWRANPWYFLARDLIWLPLTKFILIF